MKNKSFIYIGCCLLFCSVLVVHSVFAQQKIPKALNIGDTAPNEFWERSVRLLKDGSNISLSDFQQPLQIIYFWSTWCKGCMLSFPKLDSLQRAFREQVAIIPVTYEPRKKVLDEFKKFKISIPQLPVVVEESDTLGMGGYFPRRIAPHVVIFRGSKIETITHGYELTRDNIRKLINGENSFSVKMDIMDFKANRPLLINNNGMEDNRFLMRSLFAPHIEGVPSVFLTQTEDPENKRSITRLVNASFRYAWSAVFPVVSNFNPKQFIIPANCAAIADTVFCYELGIPIERKAERPLFVQRDFEMFFGVGARMVTSKKPAMILRPRNAMPMEQEDIRFESAFVLNPTKIESSFSLVQYLNWNTPQSVPFMVRPAQNQPITFKKPVTIHSLKELNEQLKPFKLEIVISEEEFPNIEFYKIPLP